MPRHSSLAGNSSFGYTQTHIMAHLTRKFNLKKAMASIPGNWFSILQNLQTIK
jgi:hypothetical protein